VQGRKRRLTGTKNGGETTKKKIIRREKKHPFIFSRRLGPKRTGEGKRESRLKEQEIPRTGGGKRDKTVRSRGSR